MQVIEDYASGREHRFQDSVWTDLKEWLLRKVFHGKCAYCEALVGVTGFGDAEHFRPKGKVTVLVDEKTVTVQVGGKDHPGYYWLAYDWRNLLPACSQCNTGGKMNHFPIARTHVTVHDAGRNDPDDLDAIEEPLLLNPYKDQPHEHILFGDRGFVTAVDGKPKGQSSIEIYKLKRGPLIQERQARQELVWIKVLDAMKAADGSSVRVLEPYLQGREPYSRAVVDYVRLKMREETRGFGIPLEPPPATPPPLLS